MNWKESCRARLPKHLDAQGDLAPPWQAYPTYERYSMGWRMGAGEDWMGLWHVFLEQLSPDFETRLAYLRRHPAAPVSWADAVHDVLFPVARHDDDDDQEYDEDDTEDTANEVTAERRASLLNQGLIASDVAFATWLTRQTGVRWPWTYSETPRDAARYWTRELWFWSRQIAGLRSAGAWSLPPIPDSWQTCAAALETGNPGSLELREGLLSLAHMLCAGTVIPPWQLGLDTADFADSFDDDMGYVDAFRLWGMSAFDDAEHLQRYLEQTNAPTSWRAWIDRELPVD